MRLRSVGWLALLLAFTWGAAAWGEPVTSEVAEDVANAFVDSGLAKSDIYKASMGIPADVRVYTYRALTDGTSPDVLAHVFELKPSGFIVVTADTEIVPIVAYSFTGTFSWEESNQNILLDMLRQDMANRLRAVQEGQIAAGVAVDNEQEWDEYRGICAPELVTYEAGVYGPWTLDPWSQSSPYYDDCPMDPNKPVLGTHSCVVGCTATALAQILNYWQYPTSVTFLPIDDYTSVMDPAPLDAYGTRTIPITATTANFSGLNYNNCNPLDAAKAKLSYAAGVSVRMNYSSEASAAYIFQVARALAGTAVPNFWNGGAAIPQANKRWGYDSADLRTYASSWGSPWTVSQETFYGDLESNMRQARPAEMGISGSLGAHAIVVDGYHPTDEKYHLNFGWGTSSYAWYSLPSGLPPALDTVQSAVYNIVPTTSTYTMSTSTSGTGAGTVQALPGTGALTRGTHVLVSATASPGSSFSNWTGALSGSDNPALVILDGNKTVNAVFSGPPGTAAVFRTTAGGDVYADKTFHAFDFLSGGADVAEWVEVSELVEPGDVLEFDPENPGQYRKARGPCSSLIAGVVSSDPGVILGTGLLNAPPTTHHPLPTDSALLALIGIVPVKACDEGGPILPGDLLVTASRSGYVRRGNSEDCAAIVGKALEPLVGHEGLILVLLTR